MGDFGFYLNYLSILNIVTYVVTLLGAVLFLRIKHKSEATKNLGLGLLFYSGISIVFTFQFGVYNPIAATVRALLIICALKASIYFTQFFLTYPNISNRDFAKKLKVSQWIIALSVDAYAIYTCLTSEKIFRNHGEYWDITATTYPIIASIFLLSFYFIFIGVAVWKIRSIPKKSRRKPIVLLLGILFCVTLPALGSFLSNTGMLDRTTFFSLYAVNTTLGWFVVIVTYINVTKDQTTFLTKISGISLLSLLLLISAYSYTGFNRIKETFNATHFTITKILSRHPYIPDNMEYAVSLTPKTNREYYLLRKKNVHINFKNTDYNYDNTTQNSTPIFREDTVSLNKRYISYQYYDANQETLYEAGFNYITYKKELHSFGITLLVFLCGVLVLVLFGYPLFFQVSLLDPIKKLIQNFKQVEKGNLNTRCTPMVMDEIGQMTTSFNAMVQKLLISRNKIEEYSNNLESMVDQRTQDLNTKNLELQTTMDQLKTAQQQLIHSEKMVSLGELTAGIAHEINNPTNYILNGIEPLRSNIFDILELLKKYDIMLQQHPNAELVKEIHLLKEEIDYDELLLEIPSLCDSIKNGASRTQEIVLDLKTFARDDKKEKIQADIHACLNSTIPILKSGITKKIVVTTHFGELPLIWCRPGELNQVFMNLLSNASHAIESEGEIIITTQRVMSDFIEISIKDTGPGIPKGIQEKIFEPFYTTKGVGEGTGLGLSISFGIIQNHNGTIKLHSEIGNGTEFVITLPIHDNL